MLRRKSRKGDDGPGSDWLVTFSDCMTLLLAFFVMLLSFSSFDPDELNWVLQSLGPSRPSLFEGVRPKLDKPVHEERPVDWAESGSDVPTQKDNFDSIDKPRDPLEDLSADAYRDRRVLTVPSQMLFLGRTNLLRGQARPMLSAIADYLRLVPCRVIVSETVASGADAETRDLGLARTWAVLGHFTEQEGLEDDRFGIAVHIEQAPHRPGFKPAIRIAMLSRKVFP